MYRKIPLLKLVHKNLLVEVKEYLDSKNKLEFLNFYDYGLKNFNIQIF